MSCEARARLLRPEAADLPCPGTAGRSWWQVAGNDSVGPGDSLAREAREWKSDLQKLPLSQPVNLGCALRIQPHCPGDKHPSWCTCRRFYSFPHQCWSERFVFLSKRPLLFWTRMYPRSLGALLLPGAPAVPWRVGVGVGRAESVRSHPISATVSCDGHLPFQSDPGLSPG